MATATTEAAASSRQVYLPDAKWYDFWSGDSQDGAKIFDAPSPIEQIPLFVRAGSIVPLGPEKQWSTEKVEDPIEVRIYRGADGDFTLYEDENDTYNYEKGVYATITFHWDDAKKTLTIGDRKGQFPGMLESRSFRIVMVGKNHGTGIGATNNADKVVQYSGKQISVTP